MKQGQNDVLVSEPFGLNCLYQLLLNFSPFLLLVGLVKGGNKLQKDAEIEFRIRFLKLAVFRDDFLRVDEQRILLVVFQSDLLDF